MIELVDTCSIRESLMVAKEEALANTLKSKAKGKVIGVTNLSSIVGGDVSRDIKEAVDIDVSSEYYTASVFVSKFVNISFLPTLVNNHILLLDVEMIYE